MVVLIPVSDVGSAEAKGKLAGYEACEENSCVLRGLAGSKRGHSESALFQASVRYQTSCKEELGHHHIASLTSVAFNYSLLPKSLSDLVSHGIGIRWIKGYVILLHCLINLSAS